MYLIEIAYKERCYLNTYFFLKEQNDYYACDYLLGTISVN